MQPAVHKTGRDARSHSHNGSGYFLHLFRGGTFAPFLRASDRPMAMACFLLFTRPALPRLPDRRVPRFLRRMALRTLF
jgi:hypothetical protein